MDTKEDDVTPSIIAAIRTDLPYLRQVSKPTSRSEVEKLNLVPAIKYALRTAWTGGYGLAAIQIGIPIRAAWFWIPASDGCNSGKEHPRNHHKEVLLINPKILEFKEPIVIPGEGCLSIPNKVFTVQRYNWIKLENDGQVCVAEGKEAQIIEHEIDHMDGVLVMDRVPRDKQGRNEPCACGSGKKYKKCCGK